MVLKHIPEIIATRRHIYQRYRQQLSDIPGIKLPPLLPDGVAYNYAYMPMEVDEKQYGSVGTASMKG